jgi:hypothetical protein
MPRLATTVDLARQPRPDHARGEPDHALRGDDQAGEQRRLVQHLLQVQGEHEQLPAVPQAEQEGQRGPVPQSLAVQQ